LARKRKRKRTRLPIPGRIRNPILNTAGCTLSRTQIKRVVRTPGTVADEREFDRMRSYLVRGLEPSNAF
jgi:hypothetical protein